tara:strand:- start:694 stop:912 length:219 start_codon:yes stop_codon:yes gene_type:complete
MTNIIKLAVVGAGLVGQRHINAISKQKDVKLVAIVEPNPTEDISSLDVPCFSNLKMHSSKKTLIWLPQIHFQ